MKDESPKKGHRNHLRLQAVSASDLEVLSALMQDSIVPIGDILYTPSQKKIIMMVQRFRWELIKDAGHWLHSEDPEGFIKKICKYLI